MDAYEASQGDCFQARRREVTALHPEVQASGGRADAYTRGHGHCPEVPAEFERFVQMVAPVPAGARHRQSWARNEHEQAKLIERIRDGKIVDRKRRSGCPRRSGSVLVQPDLGARVFAHAEGRGRIVARSCGSSLEGRGIQ